MFRKILLVLSIVLSLTAQAAFAGSPKEYAESIADSVVKIIESDKSEMDKENDLVALFKRNVDSEWMATFTMGKYFRQLSAAQKAKYIGLYRDYVIYSYIPKFRLYAGERMQVMQVLEDDKNLFTVKTTLKTKASSTGKVFVDYKLKRTDGNFKIVDVVGEGVSLINTQRSDFSVPLSEKGVDYFLDRLEQKVKNLKANPPK